MREYKKRIASSLLNTTPNVINLYDDSTGDIVTFPTYDREEAYAFLMHGIRKSDWYFICEKKDLETLKLLNRSLSDIAVIDYFDVGRNATLISYLVWAVDCKTPVRLRT